MCIRDRSRQAFQASQRPIVSLGRADGVIAEFAAPTKDDPPDTAVGIKLYLHNGGQSPALTPTVAIELQALFLAEGAAPSTKPFQSRNDTLQHLVRSRGINKNAGQLQGFTSDSIPPQSTYVHMTGDQLSEEQYEATIKGQRLLILAGRYEYCDVLGNYACRDFELYYQGPPLSAFAKLNEIDCTFMYIYPPHQPDWEYLPPCEQPAEREAREQQEKDRIATAAADA